MKEKYQLPCKINGEWVVPASWILYPESVPRLQDSIFNRKPQTNEED